MDNHQLRVSSTKEKLNQSKLTAFSSPVILHKIFDHVSVKDLKSCRRVCQNWNKVATPLLGKRSYLCINKLGLKMEKHHLIESLSVNNQLVRHIKLAYQEPVPALSDGATTTTPRDTQVLDVHFYAACILYREKLEEIRMQVPFLTHVGIIAGKSWVCKAKLRKLVLHEHNHPGNLDMRGIRGLYRPTLQIMTSVEELELSADEDRVGRTDFGYQSHPTLQQIINNCPNLERLKISDNFYPDLSKCSKLKELQWAGFPYKKSPDPAAVNIMVGRDFKYDKLLELLDSVKNRLELLELGAVYKMSDDECLDDDGFQMGPFSVNCFPKLRTLDIGDFEVFEEVVNSLKPSRFPTLQKLNLSCEKMQFDNICQMFLDMPRENDAIQALTVQSFTLQKVPIYEIAHCFPHFAELFPNLNDVSVKLITRRDNHPVPVKELRGIKSIFTAFVHLEKLTIRIYFRRTLSQLMQRILGPTRKRLTSLTLILEDPSLITDDGCYSFQRVFAQCKNITFDGFLFRGNTVSTMINLALVENVNLYFIN